MTTRLDAYLTQKSKRSGAALDPAGGKTSLRVAQHRCLTALPKRGQHTEKTVVFVYSKVKERVPFPGAVRCSRPNGMSHWKHKGTLLLVSACVWRARRGE